MAGEFNPRKDSHPTKFERKPRIMFISINAKF